MIRCTNCQFENPNDARFCQNCGRLLEVSCQNCGTANTAAANFCKNCGQTLKPAAGSPQPEKHSTSSSPRDDLRLARLAAAAPETLANKIRSATNLSGERRIVTVLFADVVGSTALAERMDPEDWTSIMNEAFDQLTPVIYRYEGTIARLMGDALLAFFGAPVAHEDDPVRAAHAALDMLRGVENYAADVRRQYGIDFAIRVGMNTGPVVVGSVGSNLVYEYTAMGDAVNLAARMQTAARPMTAFITENTYRFIAPYFDCLDLGLIDVRGKTDPVRAYQVQAAKLVPNQARGLREVESPMVGRQAELETLLQLVGTLSAGIGRSAVLIGEPGLGKTRLINEWKNNVQARDGKNNGSISPRWVEGHCLSYGQGMAYHLVQNLLRSLAGISHSSDPGEIQSSLQVLVSANSPDNTQEIYPYLAHLLSLPLEEASLERIHLLDPQALNNRYFNALRTLLLSISNVQPISVVLEDIHWADPSSVDLLSRLLPISLEAPILFCCVTRPERDTPGWRLVITAREVMGPSLIELNLEPLSEAESCTLISNILEIGSLPERIREIILAKAEGNPFFVEEVIRMLIDRGAIRREDNQWILEKDIDTIEIPDNLQGLLLARIDRLPEEVKHTLRVASVIGRQFSVRVLEQILQR